MMIKTKWTIGLLGVLIAYSLSAVSVRAQSLQTFVASTGNNANDCSHSAPCQTINGAVSKTAAGGEVRVLDAVRDDGFIGIDKSITIDGSNLASIVQPVFGPSSVFFVNAGATDVITIRNLSIVRTNNDGIIFVAGKRLVVENVNMRVPNRGIDIALPAGTAADILVKDTTIINDSSQPTGDRLGVRMIANSGTPTLTIDHSYIQGLGVGLDVLSGRATISNSVVSNNFFYGIISENSAIIDVYNCVITNNNVGVQAGFNGGGSTVRLSRNVIYDNTTSIGNGPGTILSDGDNRNSNPNPSVTLGAITRQ